MSIDLGPLIIAPPLGMQMPYWVMLGVILLAAWLFSNYQIYLRLTNQSMVKRVLLLSLNTLAFVALAGLILEVKIGTVGIQSATLITRGITGAQLAKIPKLAPDATLYYLNDTGPPQPGLAQTGLTDKSPSQMSLSDSVTYLDSVAQIAQLRPDLQQLNVIGDGLTAGQWQQLYASHPNWGSPKASKLGITFISSPNLNGPINLSWQKQLMLGENLIITGKLQTALYPAGIDAKYSLTLVDPAGKTVEQQEPGPQQNFSFSVTPKTLGSWMYKLKVFIAGTESPVAIEPVAVNVSYPPPQSVAIWQSAPSFETRHLKNWAAHFGNRLTLVTQISQTKFISQQLNADGQTGVSDPNNALTAEVFFKLQDLEKYDLLLIDGRALVSLNNAQRAQLAMAVTQGLGVLILADRDLLTANEAILNNLSPAITLIPSTKDMTSEPTAAHWQQMTNSAPISWLAGELSAPQGELLVKGDAEQALVVNAQQGLGQVAVSLVKNSYSWQTGGHTQLYSQYWQHLIQHIARNRQTSYWQAEPENRLAYAGPLQKICAHNTYAPDLSAKGSNLIATMSGFEVNAPSLPLILQSSVINDSRQCAHYWAVQAGWQQFRLFAPSDETSIKLDDQIRYLYPGLAWPAWQQADKHLSSGKVAKFAVKAQAKLRYSAVHKLYFYLGLIAALTLLWLARKRI